MSHSHPSAEQRGFIRALLDNNLSYGRISKMYEIRFLKKISRTTIHRHKYKPIATVYRRRGRPPKTSKIEDKLMEHVVIENKWKSWAYINRLIRDSHNIHVSFRTLQRRMKEKFKLRSYVSKINPI